MRQQSMGCFYPLQRGNGWQQCRSIWIWNGLTALRYVLKLYFCLIFFKLKTYDAHVMFSACFGILHRKNTLFTFWTSWYFSCMELQICRYFFFFVSTFVSKFSEDLHFFALSLCFYSHLLIIVDVEFGRLQARDMLQHLWTGPILNASIDVVQVGQSVEVRAVGVT